MFVVIFEVQPKPERFDDYLDLAKSLKPRLEAIDGFLDNERYRSRRTDGRILSLSTWRDEKSVVRWRTHAEHHAVQERGRFEVFQDYRIRIGEVTVDTAPPPGLRPVDQRLDATEVGARAITITELAAGTDPARLALPAASPGVVDHEAYESIYNPGKLLLLASWADAGAAGGWRPAASRHRQVRVIRDYGMFDRREAPQYYPPVGGSPA